MVLGCEIKVALGTSLSGAGDATGIEPSPTNTFHLPPPDLYRSVEPHAGTSPCFLRCSKPRGETSELADNLCPKQEIPALCDLGESETVLWRQEKGMEGLSGWSELARHSH